MTGATKSYHQRRTDLAITDEAEIERIIRSAKYLTLAMCRGNEPYLATISHGYDAGARAFYFHCSPRGKKVDLLRDNPLVWGQVIEDRGYCAGQCEHAYRTVQFRGTVSFIDDEEDKRRALMLMADQLEPDPEPVKARQIEKRSLKGIAIGRVDVEVFTAKQGPVMPEEQ